MIRCLLLGVAILGCDPAAIPYEQAARMVRAPDWALVQSVSIDYMNRGSSAGRAITLPADPHVTGHEWILAHEVAHVRQRIDLAWWQGWYRQDFLPCTPYGAMATHENQAEAYAAATTGRIPEGCERQAQWIKEYDRAKL